MGEGINMWKFTERSLVGILVFSLSVLLSPGVAYCQEHVVTPEELQRNVVQAANARQADEARLERFLATPAARQAMREAKVDYKTVEKGVRMLSDAEVARLAARAEGAQKDFAAGSITQLELIIILVAIIIIIVVVAKA
jgi:pyruvate/2-oxoglutarate dehydrogenase complex dihydrolipoamide acyltransferase (E2) component